MVSATTYINQHIGDSHLRYYKSVCRSSQGFEKLKLMLRRIELNQNKVIEKKSTEEKKKDSYKIYNQYRNQTDSEYVKFYKTQKWVKLRNFVMTEHNYLCQHCLKRNLVVYADVVDHIVPTKINWNRRLDITNLEPLCDNCHKIKTKNDLKKYQSKNLK